MDRLDTATQILGQSPVKIVEKAAKVANELIYKCSTALEAFLTERYRDFAPEIEHGVTSIETLLESAVDASLEKYELYTLRNVFATAETHRNEQDDVWLQHAQDVDHVSQSLQQISALGQQVYETKQTNALLKAQSRRLHNLQNSVRAYGQALSFLSPDTIKDLDPFKDTIMRLATQASQTLEIVEEINSLQENGATLPMHRRDELLAELSQAAITSAKVPSPTARGHALLHEFS